MLTPIFRKNTFPFQCHGWRGLKSGFGAFYRMNLASDHFAEDDVLTRPACHTEVVTLKLLAHFNITTDRKYPDNAFPA